MKMDGWAAAHPRLRGAIALTFLVASTVLTPGCRLIQTTAEVPGNVVRTVGGKGGKPPPDPVVLQQELFRYTDKFSTQINLEYVRLQGAWPDAPLVRLLESQLHLNYRLLEISSGPNAFANLVDMVFSVIALRRQVEKFGLTTEFGEVFRPTADMLRDFNDEIVALALETLGEEQQRALSKNINAWLEINVTSPTGGDLRYAGSVAELLGEKTTGQTTEAPTLMGMLMLDPFAGLDPTVKEITQTRLFAERAMYVAQRMPKILQMEMELFKRRTLVTPEVSRVLEDVDGLSRSVERISVTVSELPDRFRAEREALVRTLKDEREGFTVLVEETGKALENLNTVVLSTDTFLRNLGIYDKPAEAATAPPVPTEAAAAAAPTIAAEPAAPSEPFRIQDYTTAAAQLTETSERLNTLIMTLDRTLATATSDEVVAKVDAASQTAVARGREVVDHAFVRGLLFFALCCVMVVASVLLYKLMMRKARG